MNGVPDILRLLMGGQGLMPQDANAQGGAAPLPVPGATPSPMQPQEAPQPDITVSGVPIERPKRHELFTGGPFATGKTGGNILGILGDALRAHAGLAPMYAPKLEQARASEALEGYQSDPTNALDKFLMVNPEKALGAINTYQDNDRANRATTAVLRDKDADYENMVRGRAGSMLYSANEKTFPQVRARAQAYLDAKGITGVSLPQTWEEAQNWSKEDVPVKDQMASDDTRAYRTATLDQRARDSAAREAYYKSNVAERRGYHQGVIANNDPTAKPPTPTTVLGRIQNKVAQFGPQALTPGERQIYDDSFKGKTRPGAGGASGIKVTRDPVTGKVTITK